MQDNKEFKRRLINRAFKFARSVITLVDMFPNKRSAWVIADQLIRAATSIGANIIEAQAASSRDELAKILGSSIATLKGKNKL
ncbi:MAG: four helix bundle protein [Candidatus Blackburnbacteria bacterium]|nr:four helix bundle protein [Candidatus Blackburnbacteria bacterium]